MLNEAAKIVSDPADKKIKLAFTSVPKKFITTYSEFEVCEKEFQKTTKSPILFNDLKFKEVDEVVNWFSAFSQGSGNEGKRLYQECPGSCSPQYCLEISDSEGRLQVNASVICGHARDKNDGSYRMILRRE